MVNKIDETQRRQLIAEAVWAIIVQEGLNAVSLRSVAAEAQLATGSVRHFFPSQAQLLNFAMEALADTVSGRIERATTHSDPAQLMVAVLSELIPLTDRTEAEFTAHLEFVQRSRTDANLLPVAQQINESLRDVVLDLLTSLKQAQMLDPEVDMESQAVALHALLDGLTIQLITAPYLITRDKARAALTHWVESLLTKNAKENS